MPHFDIGRFARDLEAAYRQMWETWTAGGLPAAFSVSPPLPPTIDNCHRSTKFTTYLLRRIRRAKAASCLPCCLPVRPFCLPASGKKPPCWSEQRGAHKSLIDIGFWRWLRRFFAPESVFH